tara:strand:+ start:2880 stop:3527 length:648 start_codon:yes stop_codon:yes gene_type:complete
MFHLVVVTRNKSLYVKTLHSMLALQNMCAQLSIPIDISFVNDANKSKMELIKKKLKTGDRLGWFEYGTNCSKVELQNMIWKYDKYDGIVFPVVNEGINWDQFCTSVKAESKEPIRQMALDFDTSVTTKVVDSEKDLWQVDTTDPHIWSIDCKHVLKKIKPKKGALVIPSNTSDFFKLCKKSNVNLVAAVASETFSHFTHECVGNIMNMSGLKVTG